MISLAQTQRRRYYEPKLTRVILLLQSVCLQLKMSYRFHGCPGNPGVYPSPRTTNSTHSSELPRSLWSTPGVSPNSRVHIPVTSGPPPGPVIDPCGGVGKRVNFTQTGVGLARSPQPPDARRAALHWPRVPGGTNGRRGAHSRTPLGR